MSNERDLITMCVLVLAGSCGLAGAGGLSAKDAATARKIYVAKCAKCHKFYDPKNFSDAEWDDSIDRMSRKSKIKPEQELVIKKYLAEYRAGKIANLPGTKK